jgi:hypothetical protein
MIPQVANTMRLSPVLEIIWACQQDLACGPQPASDEIRVVGPARQEGYIHAFGKDIDGLIRQDKLDPEYNLLFEKVMNAIHQKAPSAKLCFNTNPSNTAEAILRWT